MSKAKRRGQYRAASIRGFLMACGSSAGPSAATWSPFSKAAWGLPGASEISSQRDLLLPVLRRSQQKVRDKGQEMGWCV